jgi:enoyl-CoA hydratase
LTYFTFESKKSIGIITFNRPDSLNVLSTAAVSELLDFFSGLESESSCQGLVSLVLTGAGKAFIAGADIREMKDFASSDAQEFCRRGNELMQKIEELSIPVIAAVNGYAFGGGLEMALSADLIFASRTAKFAAPEVKLGIIPGFGGHMRLADRIGTARAKELIYTGRTIDAEEAFRLGLVNRICDSENLLEEVKDAANEIAGVSRHAVTKAKFLLNQRTDKTADDLISQEVHAFGDCFGYPDQREGMDAYLERRKPVWN